MFAGVEEAMASIGFDEKEMFWMWALVTSVLKLGNISFGAAEEAAVANPGVASEVAELLRFRGQALIDALTTRRIKAGSDWISSPNTREVATNMRDGFAKAIYSRVFQWLVVRINMNLFREGEGVNQAKFFIGILDIFGFEIFEVNSLEQLCINFTNEKLQARATAGFAFCASAVEARAFHHALAASPLATGEAIAPVAAARAQPARGQPRSQATFNTVVFQAAMEENAEEGVEVEVADMSEIDNSECIELMEAKPHGILSVLNEECVVPKGSDKSFLDKVFQQQMTNKRLKRPLKQKDAFQISHFAGLVTYTSAGILDKNKDPVSEDLMVLLKGSDEPTVRTLSRRQTRRAAEAASPRSPSAPPQPAGRDPRYHPQVRQLFSSNPDDQTLTRKKAAKFQGVVANFQQQLADLLAVRAELEHGTPGGAALRLRRRRLRARALPPRRQAARARARPRAACAPRALRCHHLIGRAGLGALQVIDSSETHFVRCIKPNLNKKPVEWNDDVVTKQLRCSGVMEAVRVIAAGFPDRVPHFEIVGRFAMLVPGTDRPSIEREGEKQAATRTLRALGLREGEFVAGTTKMFLKAGVLADLRVMREKKITGNATYMQAHVRGMVARKLFRVLWEEEMERRRREEEERKRREEEERLRREEEERKKREAEELAKLAGEERGRILEEERRRKEEEAAREREEAERRRQEEEVHRLAQEALEREREDEEAARHAEDAKKRFAGLRGGFASDGSLPSAEKEAADASSGTGFKLDMGKVTGAAQKAAELEPDMAKWTPRARPKDAPKQSARYQSDFKGLPEDVLEYAVYLGMDPKEDADLLWIASEALTAAEPEGWAEQMDPNGNVYYFNETTGQSSRQHPLDEYYQNLYLKLKLQRAMEVAGMEVPDTLKGRDMSNLTTEDLMRMRAQLAAKMEGEASVQQQSSPEEVAAATTSISQALTMTTPRSTKVMSEKFGISQPDTDVRALLINPAKWAEKPSFIETVIDKDTSTPMLPRYHMYMNLSDSYRAFAFSASKRVVAHNTHFAISLDHVESANTSDAFCGKLRCNSKGTEYAIYDDSNDPYGLKTGKPRRELGIISYKKKMMGPLQLEVVMPRVRKDGACAQFRPSQPEESMIQLYKAGRVEHMFILKGTANVAPGGVVELFQNARASDGQQQCVFQAHKNPEGNWAVRYMHPLSCFQAFNIAVSIFHNPSTSGLDALPAAAEGGNARASSEGGSSTTPADVRGAAPAEAPPPLAGKPTSDLGSAKAGSIINTASLEGLSHAVYSMAVQGQKVYSGLYNGNIQVWHMDAYVNLPSGSRPEYHTLTGHKSSIYSLVVTERQLLSASHDKLIKVWDLNTMRCRHTLRGHNSRVRALARSASLLFSGSNDKSIKVWNLDSMSNTHSLESHVSWIRALATEKDVLTSASKDLTVKVWDIKTLKCIFTFQAGSEVYCLAMTNSMVYGGCQDYKIRVWNLNTMQKSYMLIGHEGVVRCLFVRHNTLYSGGSDSKVKVWDLKTNDCTTLFGHTSFVRAIAVDEGGHTLYTGADDRCVPLPRAPRCRATPIARRPLPAPGGSKFGRRADLCRRIERGRAPSSTTPSRHAPSPPRTDDVRRPTWHANRCPLVGARPLRREWPGARRTPAAVDNWRRRGEQG